MHFWPKGMLHNLHRGHLDVTPEMSMGTFANGQVEGDEP